MRVAIVAEGVKDQPILEELVPRIDPRVITVIVRPAQGKRGFRTVFPALLWTFQYVAPGPGPAEKAIVIRDSDRDDPATVEASLRARLAEGRHPPFLRGVEIHVTVQETETWMLADVNAINQVATANGGRRVPPVRGPLEAISDAKERFAALLKQAGLPHVPGIVREVARSIDLAAIEQACPGFRVFEQKIRG